MTLPGGMDLRCGRWQDVLADVPADSVITDVPYSERTISGHRSGGRVAADGWQGPVAGKIGYAPWAAADAAEFSAWAKCAARSWVVVFCDHIIFRWLEAEFSGFGWMTFAPVPWVKTDAAPRLHQDGPSPQAETIFVSRPRGQFVRGYRPGWYMTKQGRDGVVVGGKPGDLMRAVVADYTSPGDTVVDPFSGGGSTLLAAAELGCRAIGAEMDPETYQKAHKRLAKGFTPMPHPRAHRANGKPQQGALW